METFLWRQHFCIMDSGLYRARGETLVVARRALIMSDMSCLSRWGSFTEVLKECVLDVFQFCSKSEEKYAMRLIVLDPSLVASWAGREYVDDWTMCFAKLQLCVDFRYLEKANSQYRSSFVCNERRTRTATGDAVPYQCWTQNHNPGAKRMIACAKLTVAWSQIKV